jgi:hypothetical protein
MELRRDDYDSPWKEALESYTEDFMRFFFPQVHAAIDWSRGVEFLDGELRQVVRDAKSGRRYLDKLLRVTLGDGSDHLIYIHIEIQGDEDVKFPKRVYVYNYRLFDRHDEAILSLAVLADDDPAWRPCSFSLSLLGCELVLTFPTAKLLDWAGRETELRASDNVFARVTLAHLATRATRSDPAKRYAAKKELLHLLYERNFDRQRIVDVFAIVDWMMYLPDELERKLWQDIAALEESRNMRYVTSVERLGHERGLQEGARQAEIRMLLRLLEQRFGPVPEVVRSRIAEAGVEDLETWLDRVVTAPSLGAVLADAKAH